MLTVLVLVSISYDIPCIFKNINKVGLGFLFNIWKLLTVCPFVFLSVCLSVSLCQAVCLSLFPSICLSLSVCPSVCLFVYLRLSVCLSVRLSVYSSVCLSLTSVCLFIRLSFTHLCLSVYLSVCLSLTSVCLFIRLSVFHSPLSKGNLWCGKLWTKSTHGFQSRGKKNKTGHEAVSNKIETGHK